VGSLQPESGRAFARPPPPSLPVRPLPCGKNGQLFLLPRERVPQQQVRLPRPTAGAASEEDEGKTRAGREDEGVRPSAAAIAWPASLGCLRVMRGSL
jgi:hypothetical protein